MGKGHTIQKQLLEITTSDPSAKMGFQQEVQDFYTDLLLPAMESLFDRYAGPGSRIRAEKLEINVTLPGSKAWQKPLCDAVIRELEQALRGAVRQDMGGTAVQGFADVSREDERAVFFHFLATGSLPWYAGEKGETGLKDYIRRVLRGEAVSWGLPGDPKSFMSRVVRLLATHEQALSRWLWQFGEETLNEFFSDKGEYKLVRRWEHRLPPVEGGDTNWKRWSMILSLLAQRAEGPNPSTPMEPEGFRVLWKSLPVAARSSWWRAAPAEERSEIARLLGAEEKDLPEENLAKDGETPLRKKEDGRSKRPEEEGIFIENAGLVLLHPFLAPLFSGLGWWDGKLFESGVLHQRAVLLSQYMVLPGEEFPEYELLLNKILCGYDPEETLPAVLEVTEREEQEVSDLLQAVIGHWTMNGRAVFTTVENLRASFLQRTGKISRRSSGDWLLQVEKKGYDIVLNSLPWGIGMIRHPWMPDMLRVEWR